MVCGACSGGGAEVCPRHGIEFLDYKCRYCCSVAVWFCFGTTHFCNKCHNIFDEMQAMADEGKFSIRDFLCRCLTEELTTWTVCKGASALPVWPVWSGASEGDAVRTRTPTPGRWEMFSLRLAVDLARICRHSDEGVCLVMSTGNETATICYLSVHVLVFHKRASVLNLGDENVKSEEPLARMWLP